MAFETPQYHSLNGLLKTLHHFETLEEFHKYLHNYRALPIILTTRGLTELACLEPIIAMIRYQVYFRIFESEQRNSEDFHYLFRDNMSKLDKKIKSLKALHVNMVPEVLFNTISASLQILQLLEAARTGVWTELDTLALVFDTNKYSKTSNGDILPYWCIDVNS